jgi:hypothetical protein
MWPIRPHDPQTDHLNHLLSLAACVVQLHVRRLKIQLLRTTSADLHRLASLPGTLFALERWAPPCCILLISCILPRYKTLADYPSSREFNHNAGYMRRQLASTVVDRSDSASGTSTQLSFTPHTERHGPRPESVAPAE